MADTMPQSSGAAVRTPQPVSQYPKQAIVVLHGMGEQRPMDTIKGFVRAVWETDGATTGNAPSDPAETWSRPDPRTGSLELRRITTRQSVPSATFPEGVRSDFFELYWADLSGGSTWSHVKAWIFGLLFRNPVTQVPRRVLFAWCALWMITLVVMFLGVATALPARKDAAIGAFMVWDWWPFLWLEHVPKWTLLLVTAGLGALTQAFIVPYFGRVVRYTRATPENIAARKNIRERGLALLRTLHARDYDRIIVVGHSLGSIVAYDLISYFWAERMAARTVEVGTGEHAALRELEKAIANSEKDTSAFLEAQRAFLGTVRRRDKPAKEGDEDRRWLITDLVTLGSPLAHAEFLLARDRKDLAERHRSREYPTCPPLQERVETDAKAPAEAVGFDLAASSGRLMSFPVGSAHWQLHHAAPFAAVRWTNVFDPSFLVLLGDVVSGPVSPAFGRGIVDVDLRALRKRQSWSFTHTSYWRLPGGRGEDPCHIVQLRRALDLAGRREV